MWSLVVIVLGFGGEYTTYTLRDNAYIDEESCKVIAAKESQKYGSSVRLDCVKGAESKRVGGNRQERDRYHLMR